MAASLDGKIAAHPLESDQERRRYGFVNDEDHVHLRTLLEGADAVVTGANSVRAVSGAWAVPNRVTGQFPIWVVLTRRGLEPGLRFFSQSELPRWVVSPRSAVHRPPAGVVDVAYDEDGQDPAVTVAERLRAAGCETVLLFGGSEINRIFYAAALVDELILTLCPVILATSKATSLVAPPLATPIQLECLSSQRSGSHVFLKYRILK